MSFTRAANDLWLLLNRRNSRAFHAATRNVAGTQERLLRDLMRRNADSAFGRHHDFASISSVAQFQARVPLSTYDDFAPYIDRIAAGERGVLTAEPVLLLEPTSGSTAATRLIPYTASLKREFGRAIAPWIVDLYGRFPDLRRGQVYWSVSPVAQREQRTAGGIPIGFEDDSAYFGRVQSALIRSALAVPPLVKLLADVPTFRYVTLLFLLRSRSLALLSVWNPTFLTLLLDQLPAWWPQLADDIAAGTITSPAPLPPDLHRQLAILNRRDPARATEIRSAFTRSPQNPILHLWPQLRVVSCWTDANAALPAAELRGRLPRVHLQGKGLLATEGVVSLPIEGLGAALALRSHFFEFVDEATGEVRLAHHLERGATYAVVITTGGGLYRYQLHDLVEVTGLVNECPLLRFVGKAAHISDHVGEKLNERHVSRALHAIFDRHGVQPRFAMLACETLDSRLAYTLFVEAAVEDRELMIIGTELEAALCENFHYRYCRELGQLGSLRVFRIDGGAQASYIAACQTHGQRLGDIKPVALHGRGGWIGFFRGCLLAE